MKHVSFIVIFLTFFAFVFFASADFSVTDWKFRKEIFGSGEGFILLDLDEETLNKANSNLSDLRIVNEDGEVPYTIFAEGDSSSVIKIPARMLNKSFVAGSETAFELDLGLPDPNAQRIFHNRVELHTYSENFRRRVIVEGSNDGKNWKTLTTKGQIYDFTVRDERPAKAQDTVVDYPESTVRYLRVRIRDNGEEPLNITGATVFQRIETRAKETTFQPAVEITENSENNSTEVIADLGGRGIPTRKATLSLSDTNFNRRISIYASDDKQSWRRVGDGYVFRIQTPKFEGENVTIPYREITNRYVKFVIHNQDDRPLSVEGVKLFGIARKLVFDFNPSKRYMLYYGNENARSPRYDISKLLAYLEIETFNHASLGNEEENPDFEEQLPPLTERNNYVLPVALGIIVAVLAFLLLRIFTKVKSSQGVI